MVRVANGPLVASGSTDSSRRVWAGYDAWNNAIEAEFFSDSGLGGRGTGIHAFGSGYLIRGADGRFVKGTTSAPFAGGRPVYLDLEEDVLLRLADQVHAEGEPKEALAQAVIPTLYLWPEHDGSLLDLHVRRLSRWQQEGRVGAPPCLAVLALFSLAAEGMRRDENFRSNNYYARLAQLLGFDPATHREAIEKLERDFRRDSLTLWNSLNSWLLDAGGARGMPTAYSFDWRSHVGPPISQALLREEERLALRDLFVRYRLRPGRQIAASDMLRLLEDWLPGSDLDVSLKRLFKQADVKARIADIASIELEHWDGSAPAAAVGHPAPADTLLLAASVRRLPRPRLEFSLVLRGRAGAHAGRFKLADDAGPAAAAAFQGVNGVLRLIDPPGDGWRRLEADGEIGFPDLLIAAVQLVDPGGATTLTRKPRRLVILERDEEFRIAVEVDRIQLARENVILAHESLGDDVDALLRTCARDGFRRWRPDELRGLPLNWQVWTSVELIDVPNVPETPEAQDLTTLIPLEWTQVAFGGGLALPGAAAWLRGAPPEVRVASFVDRDVVASLAQTDALSGDPEIEETLLTFDGAAVVSLEERGLRDGDYRVALRETGAHGKPLASALFRLRSGNSPRLITEIDGEIAHHFHPAALAGALTATIADRPPDPLPLNAPAMRSEALDADTAAIPSALPSLATHDFEDETESTDPIVEARSGRMTGCLMGGGHHYKLDDAGRDAMQRRRWAARRMIPAQCLECGHQKLFPPHLRHAHGGSARVPAVRAVKASPAPRAAAAVRAITEPMAMAAGFDLLLDALTYVRAGRWSLFERLAQQIAEEPWFPLESARLLSALGHIDLVIDLAAGRPRAWGIRPATLVARSEEAVLTGARPQELVDVLAQEAAALGGTLAQHAAPGAPQVIIVHGVEGGDLANLAASVSDRTAVPLAVDLSGALGLALALPDLTEVADALPRFEWPLVATERFDFASNKWVSAPVDGPGSYKFSTRPLRFGAVLSSDRDGAMLAADSRLVKWLGAPSPSTLLAYESESETLLCRLGAQLPGLYERAAVLCGGKPPEKRVDGSVAYASVPPRIAAALHKTLVSQRSRP